MRFIDAEAVHAVVAYPAFVAALAAEHRKGIDAVERLLLGQPARDGAINQLLIWPAWRRDDALGVKVVTIFPGNTAPGGPPTVQAVYLLFDGANGQPAAAIDGTALTYCKTAADSALGATFLARKDVASMLMVGAGALAPHLIRAHCAIRPSLKSVAVWNRTPEKAARLAQTLSLPGVAIIAVDDLATAARSADIVCCATMATAPLIHGQWLKPGVHFDLVGGYTPDMREADDTAIRRASVFVDSRWFTVEDCGDIAGPIASGTLRHDGIAADLFDLCGGSHPGRRSVDEITLFKNAGGAHLDLMAARIILKLVDERSTRRQKPSELR